MNAHCTANTAKALSLIIPPSILVRDSGYRWMRNVGHVIELKSERS
jgi:hypothetical protein